MFDGLKKKLGFGSSDIPAKEPESTPEQPKKVLETEGSYHRRRMKKGKGAFAAKEEYYREMEEKKRHAETLSGIAGAVAPVTVMITPGMDYSEYSAKLAEAKRDFKRKLGGEPMTTEEMSRVYKDTAHGSDDKIAVTFGQAVVDHGEAYAKLTESAVFKADKFEISGFTVKVDNTGKIAGIGLGDSGGMTKIRNGLMTFSDPSGKPMVEIGELSAGIAPAVMKGFHGGAVFGGAGKSTTSFEELQALKEKQAKDHETTEMKRLSRDFVKGVGEEMTNAFASAAVRGEACEFAGEVLKRLMVAAQNNGINIHELLEEVEMTEEEKSKEALALDALAKSVTEYWGSPDYELDQTQFSLSGPVSLTILRAPSETHKSGYGKKAHIGGEEFVGEKAYLGKRGQIICCFKPVGVEDYTLMEMALGDCFAQLTGFQKHFVEQGFSLQFQAIRDAKNQEKQAADLEKFSSQYADFGSF